MTNFLNKIIHFLTVYLIVTTTIVRIYFCFVIPLGKEQNLSKAISSITTDECGPKEARTQGCFQHLLCHST